MKRSTDRILTTHAGSLPRPLEVLEAMREKLAGHKVDLNAYDTSISKAVNNSIARQAETGIDIVADGEMSKPGFFTYARQRLDGFETRPKEKFALFEKEVEEFPDYYKDYFTRAMLGGSVANPVPLVCTGPIKYIGMDLLQKDLGNLKAALGKAKHVEAFVPSTAPSGVGTNEYYNNDDEFFEALGEAMREEYKAIVEAGFIVQVDDPFLSDICYDLKDDKKALDHKAGLYVESINHALRGIPRERVRFHTCYGINEGPRLHEAALAQVAPYMFKVNAQAFSFEMANVRHEHEYHLFESFKLPADTILVPGTVHHGSSMIEHPELIAERIMRLANIVGRENVIAGADCGFSSQATFKPEVDPKAMWMKFRSMVEGAKIASKKLWS
ncbi:MAG: cobalamin-independent methionine synthase II family protein [Beijerinckiaceae bacterium]|jgi:5-methyltetrahydropteroyltriglutamate--homocysteine methyltransferase|nr:cobalamin-independent methionine synthase II family protein [Beijerinckiaceae bacterium]